MLDMRKGLRWGPKVEAIDVLVVNSEEKSS